MTESQLQDQIRLVLNDSDGVWWRNNCGVAEVHGYRIRFGIGNPGGSDLVGIFRGRAVFVEIKTPSGRQSDEQKRFESLVRAKGAEYVILRSVEDAKAWLDDIRVRY